MGAARSPLPADAGAARAESVADLSAELAPTVDNDIENACAEWDESKHPFVSVATITIPPQDFDSAQQRTMCESLRYSPWHGIAEHRPLGGINRLRRGVYEASANFREAVAGGATPEGAENRAAV